MFWYRFSSLCTENGKSPNAVAKELNIPSGSVTAWKNGATPRNATLLKIASYFGVSVDFLSGNDQKEKLTIPEKGELTAEQIKAIEKIKNMPPEELAKKLPALVAVLDM